jgi:hypothetical protein
VYDVNALLVGMSIQTVGRYLHERSVQERAMEGGLPPQHLVNEAFMRKRKKNTLSRRATRKGRPMIEYVRVGFA